jgi:hypothetical protein
MIVWANDRLAISDSTVVAAAENIVLTVYPAAYRLSIGQTVNLSMGCAHTTTACKNIFNNEIRYGGMPYRSLNNPFTTVIF